MKTGGKDLALRLEDEGYGPILREAGLAADVPDEALLVPKGPSRGAPRGEAMADRRSTRATTPEAAPASAVDRRRSTRAVSAGTSRSSTSSRTATRSSSSTPRRRARSRGPSSTRSTTYYREYNANVHRGIYEIGERATAAYEAARASVARFINAPDPHEVIFTRNATEAINLVAYSWGRKNIDRGDAIVLTEMEHHANLVPWQLLAQERDGDLEFIPITDDGDPPPRRLRGPARLKPKLVAFTHVSNTLGTINPVEEMTRMAHEAGALVLIDGAQAVPHVPVDVQAIGADFYAFSGHKMLGADRLRRAVGAARAARGDAAVHGRRRHDPRGPPPSVRVQRIPGSSRPARRTSRPPIGLGAAADYLIELGMDRVREHERELLVYAFDALRARPATSSCTARWTRTSAVASPVQRPRRPSARRRAGAGSVRRRGPRRPPLHDAAPRAPRARRHRARQLQRLHDGGRHRRPGAGLREVAKLFGVERPGKRWPADRGLPRGLPALYNHPTYEVAMTTSWAVRITVLAAIAAVVFGACGGASPTPMASEAAGLFGRSAGVDASGGPGPSPRPPTPAWAAHHEGRWATLGRSNAGTAPRVGLNGQAAFDALDTIEAEFGRTLVASAAAIVSSGQVPAGVEWTAPGSWPPWTGRRPSAAPMPASST